MATLKKIDFGLNSSFGNYFSTMKTYLDNMSVDEQDMDPDSQKKYKTTVLMWCALRRKFPSRSAVVYSRNPMLFYLCSATALLYLNINAQPGVRFCILLRCTVCVRRSDWSLREFLCRQPRAARHRASPRAENSLARARAHKGRPKFVRNLFVSDHKF